MQGNYLLIHKSILPDYYEKVLQVRRMLESGKAKDVSQAVKQAGISRSTYYKYKDYILEPSSMPGSRKVVLGMMLDHEPGVLSSVLSHISAAGASVNTISQSPPVHDIANLTVTLDIGDMSVSTEQLIDIIRNTQGVEKPKLLAVE